MTQELEITRQQRELILYELNKAMPVNGPAIHTVKAFGIIWLHLSDWYGRFNLPLLIENEIFQPRPDLIYEQYVSWKVEFQPKAYQLTVKGRGILDNWAIWVEKGEWVR